MMESAILAYKLHDKLLKRTRVSDIDRTMAIMNTGVRLGSLAIKSIGVLNWPRRKVWGAGNGPVIVLGVIHHGRWKEPVGRARLGFGGSTRAGGTARRGWRCKCRTGRIDPSAGPQMSSSAKPARQLLLRGSNGEGQGTWSREAPVARFGARPLNHGPKNGRAAKFGVVTSWHGIFKMEETLVGILDSSA